MRLLTAVAGLGRTSYRLAGSPRMHQRPIGPLLDSLRQIGVAARSENDDGCPPVLVDGVNGRGGAATIDCSVSSQFLSGMLLMAPCLPRGLDISVTRGPVSRPYLDLTLDIMARLGVGVEREGYERFTVAGGQYRLWFRLGPIVGYGNDSFWVRIPDATSLDPTGNADNPGWVRVNGLAGQAGADTWHWGRVWDDEHDNGHVTFTLPAGTHTLEVSYRELEVPLDLILITDDLAR